MNQTGASGDTGAPVLKIDQDELATAPEVRDSAPAHAGPEALNVLFWFCEDPWPVHVGVKDDPSYEVRAQLTDDRFDLW
jgi:hypothetical protein